MTAAAAAAQPALERELRSALAAVPHARTETGVCVVRLGSNTTVFEMNPDRPLVPASSMKVFVMAAALAELGLDFAFETVCATDGSDLFIVGGGDPGFGDAKLYRARGEAITADFQRWADALLELGMISIPGDIVIDGSIFDDQLVNPSWEEGDLDNWYAAPVSSLNFNDNCVDITVAPQKPAGSPVSVQVQPEASLIRIVNKCRSAARGTPILHHPHDTFEYIISGRCAKRWAFGPVSVPDPAMLTAGSFRTVLAATGIQLTGQIRRQRVRLADGSLPASLTIVGRHRTPIGEILARAGKNSQNLFAECLLKRAGYAWAKHHGRPDPQGSWKLGGQAVLEVVKRAGIDATGLVVADGSGLSRDNRCTARQLASVMSWMESQAVAGPFRESLSVAGVDGSLGKRLLDLPGRVRGKTGTMRGVRTLSAYVDAADGSRYAFAVMFNGYTGPSTPYKEIQDRICRILARGQSTVHSR